MMQTIALFKDEAKAVRPGQLFIAQHVPFSTAKVELTPLEIPGLKTILTCAEHKKASCQEEFCQNPHQLTASIHNISDQQIQELKTQIELQKGIIEEQKKIIQDARHYAQDLQYKSGCAAVYWSLCSILKIKEGNN
jgi:hypothetical protein